MCGYHILPGIKTNQWCAGYIRYPCLQCVHYARGLWHWRPPALCNRFLCTRHNRKLPTSRCQGNFLSFEYKNPMHCREYVRILAEKVIKHWLIERVGKALISSKSRWKATKRINKIDTELGDYILHVEKKCWRIKSGRIPFLPETFLWIKRT